VLQLPTLHWEQLPTLTTDRLSLRRIRDDDVDDFYAVYSDPKVMRYWSTPPLPNLEAAAKLIREIHAGIERRELLKWAIALRTNDRLIGSVTLFHPDFTHRRVEIGYALAHAHWRMGYMGETLEAIINFAFADLNMHRIEADVDPRNTASVRTVERLGFQQEGYLRQRWQVNGEIQDALFFGLLRPDWQARASSR